MAFIPRNDEQIKVGTTPGLLANSSSFTFDGSTVGVPDFRGYEIVINEISGRGVMVRSLDYSWDFNLGQFDLLQVGDYFHLNTYYNVSFQNPVVPSAPVNPGSLISLDYFIRDIMIPNISATSTSNTALIQKLNLFIQKYEPQCLTKILGYALYKKVLNESTQRITDLVYGVEFTDTQGNLVKWKGLVRPSELISLIANFIYFYYEEYTKAHTAGVGTVLHNPEAGIAISPADKMSQAWNFFSEETYMMTDFLWIQKDVDGVRVYPEFTRDQFFETRRIARKIDSVFQF